MSGPLTWDVQTLIAMQERGEISSYEIVRAFLAEIAKHNTQGTNLRAVIEVNPDALWIAQALDRDRARGIWRGPLHGIPIVVKDNLDTADAMHTTAGSVALSEHRAIRDSEVVRRLRESGAVIIGKANMTEWANFISDHMKSGYSSRGGQTLNPYGPGLFDVGGSSAGSGAAVAAGFAVAAIGTETSGSILSPSNNNSLVGIKPTVGLVSRTGIIPISMSQDTAGPMARTVADATRVLQVISGVDATDAATLSTQPIFPNYLSMLTTGGLVGARVGIVRGYYARELSGDEQAIYEAALADLKQRGAILVDPIHLPAPHENENIDVMVYEFKVALNHYLSKTPPSNLHRSLADVIRYNETHAEVALKFGQALFERAEATSGTLTEAAYIERRLRDLTWSRDEGIDRALKANRLDALLFPSYFGCSIAAKAGYPSITVPAGYTGEGKPMGITFTGTAFTEALLIHLAYDYEQATNHRRPPSLER
ncbi:amidase family protein [Alicyclobacillus fastidiosus]|uniref:Amidase family protein n=1 Tax=Alicyclobacillus fastidiosus TaxID=392011 RepID=A0ABY6ZDL0_9BACL|nr:amidase family protein [Alicyclobacillus fastidiosus]WAH40929.1 amidase family protein [Alicyclobacillus fastidiosus]GMA62432.1 amidase [Alicyclobacillus fastidiosus]